MKILLKLYPTALRLIQDANSGYTEMHHFITGQKKKSHNCSSYKYRGCEKSDT